MRKTVIILLLISAFALKSCDVLSQSRRAVSNFERAVEAMRINDQRTAMSHAIRAIEIDNNYLEPHLMLAEIYNSRNVHDRSFYHYKRVNEIDPMFDPGISLTLAYYYHSMGEYSEAKKHIDFYFKYRNLAKSVLLDPVRLQKSIDFSLHAIANPVPFEPFNIGPGVNTKFDEYWPSLSVDERTLVFTRQIPENPDTYDGKRSSMFEGLFVSFLTPDGWSNSRPLPGGVNPLYNQGAQCISADGNTIIFTACDRRPGGRRCDLYITFRQGQEWTQPEPMTTVNSNSWDSNPSLSADGRILYFASSRAGGVGGSDIWAVRLDSNGEAIGRPQSLGPPINTEYDEVSPFIHPDGKSLYFASNGHPGLGDYDLFVSRLGDDGKWSEPENLGYPINTHGEERSLIVNASGQIAMFASEREEGKGLDIYAFEIHEEIQPTTVTYVQGYVYDAKTSRRLQAEMELIELSSEQIVAKQLSDKRTGEYLVCLPIDQDYAFNVSKEGYLFYSENFSLTNIKDPDRPQQINIPLQPIEEGVTVVMRNIFFEFDSYELLSESFAELNKISEFLKNNQNIKIEIGGHTDNVGSRAYNKQLSESRAKSVYNYLVGRGISKDQLSYKGYDFSMPIADNETEKGRAKNRRTEFKIISVE